MNVNCVSQLIVVSKLMREFQCLFAFYLLVLCAVVSPLAYSNAFVSMETSKLWFRLVNSHSTSAQKLVLISLVADGQDDNILQLEKKKKGQLFELFLCIL